MTDALNLTHDELTRLASLIVFAQPLTICADVMGLEKDEVERIIETPEFKSAKTEVLAREVDKQELLKQGWDSIEGLALGHVVEILSEKSCDPDFALKAAMVASRAPRRQLPERSQNTAFEGGVVLNLDMRFVQQVQAGHARVAQVFQNNVGSGNGNKHHDFLPPDQVEKHLLNTSTVEAGDNEDGEGDALGAFLTKFA